MTRLRRFITRETLIPEGCDNIYDERTTQIEIESEGAGAFVRISQPVGHPGVAFDTDEWPTIATCVRDMLAIIAEIEGTERET